MFCLPKVNIIFENSPNLFIQGSIGLFQEISGNIWHYRMCCDRIVKNAKEVYVMKMPWGRSGSALHRSVGRAVGFNMRNNRNSGSSGSESMKLTKVEELLETPLDRKQEDRVATFSLIFIFMIGCMVLGGIICFADDESLIGWILLIGGDIILILSSVIILWIYHDAKTNIIVFYKTKESNDNSSCRADQKLCERCNAELLDGSAICKDCQNFLEVVESRKRIKKEEKLDTIKSHVYEIPKRTKVCFICGKEDEECFPVYQVGEDFVYACIKCRSNIIEMHNAKHRFKSKDNPIY